MADTQFDVLTIGNAIVDVIAPATPDFLEREGMAEGIMHLVDADRSSYLYDRMPAEKRQISGGSSANTAAGVASYGGRAAFVGKVAADDLGGIFADDLREIGVHYSIDRLHEGPATARSMILVSPGGERTMNTYLGACQQLTTADIKEEEIGAAAVTYMEGYLWDPPEAKKAFVLASHYAHKHERPTAFTLSDPFCVNRYRDEFLDLMRSGTVDIVFANSHEIKSLYQTKSFDEALEAIRKDCRIAAVTRSEKGSVIVRGEETVTIQATTIRELVDTTGAGDLYAAGFLYGYTAGRSLKDCGDLGSLAAGLVIQQLGPRPRQNLRSAAQLAGLL